MKNLTTLLFVIMLYTSAAFSQVAINTNGNTANSSAMLDISSTSKGLLIPRMTTSQRDAISNPETGLIVFVTGSQVFYFYNGTNWEELGTGASGWELQNSTISADSLHQVVIGNNTGDGIFQVVTDQATGTYTSDQCTSGTPSAQESAAGKPASNAFDDNTTTYWSNDGNLSVWLQYKFGDANAKVIAKYRIYYEGGSYDASPKDWSFQASDDGSSWTTLDSRTNENWSSNSWKEYTFSNEVRYSYYRILISDNKGTSDNYVYINEIEMQEMTYSNHPTLFVDDNKVGIGTSFPQATLHIDGTLRLVDGNEATGKVLGSDADGNAAWVTKIYGATEIDGLSDAGADGSSIFIGGGSGINDDGSANQNAALGDSTLTQNVTGDNNTAIGYHALVKNTNSDNTAVGSNSLYHNISGENNTALGRQSLHENTSGDFNVGIGGLTGYSNKTGSNNTFLGYSAGYGSDGQNPSGSIFIGYMAGYMETSDNKLYIENSATPFPLIGGDFSTNEVQINGTIKITGGSPGANKVLTSDASGNASWETKTYGATDIDGLSDAKSDVSSVFLGNMSGNDDDGDNSNTAVGMYSMFKNTSGTYCSALGREALYYNTSGSGNAAFGSSSLHFNTNGHSNVGIGTSSLYYNTAGDYNIGIGTSANYYNQEGNNNTIIGYQAGRGISSHNKSGNIFLGYRAGYYETGDNKLYIENSLSSSPLIGGDFSTNEVYINGTIKITGGSPGANKVLTSDASGNATWETPTTYASAINDLSDGIYDGTSIFLGSDAGIVDDGINYNNAVGKEALKSNISGINNNAFGYKAMEVNTTGESNSALGNNSLGANTSGSYNTAIGFETLKNNTSRNKLVAVGYKALYNNGGSVTETYHATGNTAIGSEALYGNLNGYYNTANGYNALFSNTSGFSNTAIGYQTLYNNTGGDKNAAIGFKALYFNTSGLENTAAGYESLYSNTEGDYNIATGFQSLYSNTSGEKNVANGYKSLYSNTLGDYNTANGYKALYSNTTGNYNTANGYQALYSNTNHDNTANGYQSLYHNTSGYGNTSSGKKSLFDNTEGYFNTAFGDNSLLNNTTGIENVAVGQSSLNNNTTGDGNVAVGRNALSIIVTGNYNTTIGYNAGSSGSGGNSTNSTAIGYGSYLFGSNTVRIGNASITEIGGYTDWTKVSDGRFKTNVKENVEGLDFIMKLRPVTYNLDMDAIANFLNTPDDMRLPESERLKAAEIEIGFIAQEVEAAANELGFDFHGISKPKSKNSHYGLRYAEFVVPLVKAVQEQQDMIDKQQQLLDKQNITIEMLINKIEQIQNSK